MFTRRALVLAVLASALMSVPADSTADDVKFSALKFSTEEVELLKTIDKIEAAAGVTESMLKATPFIQILTSTSPQEMLITVTTNDWDRIAPALKALGKIRACKISAEITLFVAENGSSKQKHPNKAFFEQLRKRYDNGC